MHKKLARLIALTTCIITIGATTIFGVTMKDVGSKHWAYNEIIEMQKRGLLVPTSQGEFFPNSYVTYFELSHILAKATGYQDELLSPKIDPVLKQQIRDNFAKQKATIESYQKNYTYWQKDANEEIAYLLGKGYLKKEDLGKFISKSTSGTESKRGVRRQEMAAYLVRILHLEETAKKEYVTTGFVDESSIDPTFRPHVAYCKSLGILQGNTKNQFVPTEPITRATLSKMLVDTLKMKENGPVVKPPVTQQPPVTTETNVPTDKGLEGKLTKMISKGDGGYYVVLEIEPGKVYTYSMESTAVLKDNTGAPVALADLKDRIDGKATKDVNVTLQVSVIGTTEYITSVKLMNEITSPQVQEKPVVENKPVVQDKEDKEVIEEDQTISIVKGSVYSILIGPSPEITLQLDNGTRRKYEIIGNSELYSALTRKEITLWDLRLNQLVELELVGRKVQTLDVKKAAPAITLTGRIIKTSVTGDKIDVRVTYDPITQTENVVKTIDIPMTTKIMDGTIQRGRKDFQADMQVVIVYPEDGGTEIEQVIILSK